MRFFLIFLTVLATSPAQAQAPCDPNLKGVDNPALAYRQRDPQRCEGFYISPVSRPGQLRLVRLSRGAVRFSPQDPHLALQIPGSAVAHVRALALPEKTYYRLDAMPGKTWQWPLEVIQRGKLSAADLGIYAYLDQPETLYLPVVIDPAAAVSVTLQASQDLARLTWRYAESREGRCLAMGDWQPAREGIEAGQPIEFALPASAHGELCLEAAGQPKAGKAWLQAQWRIRDAP